MGNIQNILKALNQVIVSWNNDASRYDWPEYGYIETLRKGNFGEVYLVRHASTWEFYALKKIRCGSDEDLHRNVIQQFESMRRLSHQNIMKVHEAFFKQKGDFFPEIYMMFEYCSGGTLRDRLEKTSTKALDIKWMLQLGSAVAHIHSLDLVHRGLKPDSILLSASEDIKVGDFGLSRPIIAPKREDETWAYYYSYNASSALFYMAPEVFKGDCTEKSDVFALGTLLFAIEERQSLKIEGTNCYGIFIRLNDDDIRVPLGLQMCISNRCLSVPFQRCDVKIATIIGSALQCNPRDRASAAAIYRKLKGYVQFHA